jgi:glycerophosphoryl diester phosphodiesterase
MCIIISHRGYCIGEPEKENTADAMIRSISLGIRYVEFDVHLTTDNQLILFHDDLYRVADTTHRIRESSFAQISAAIPYIETLDRFLSIIEAGISPEILKDVTFIVDAKTTVPSDTRFIDRLTNCLENYPHLQTIISSFNHPVISALQECSTPTHSNRTGRTDHLARTALLICHIPTSEEIRTYTTDWIGIDHDSLSSELVELFHTHGKRIFAYTPNTTDEIARCVATTVDGIYTDAVEVALDVISKN